MRVELPGKVNGTAQYAIDVQVPGMLYGAILRAPVEGAGPETIDDAKAKAIAGVVRIVALPYGVGVIAETPFAAFEAKNALNGHLDAHRQGLGLRQRESAGRLRGGGARLFSADEIVGQGGRCAGGAEDGGDRRGRRVSGTISSTMRRWSR